MTIVFMDNKNNFFLDFISTAKPDQTAYFKNTQPKKPAKLNGALSTSSSNQGSTWIMLCTGGTGY